MKMRNFIDTMEIVAGKTVGVVEVAAITPIMVAFTIGETMIDMGKEIVRIIEA